MPKYRLLTKEELVQFEKEFIDYLVVNGIAGDDWQKLKTDDPEKAEQITDLFSDIVFEKILRNVSYLTYRSPKKLMAFQCLQDEIILVSVSSSEEDSQIDFTNLASIKDYEKIKAFTKTKKYSRMRELELFDMIENGCEIDDGELFKKLCLAL